MAKRQTAFSCMTESTGHNSRFAKAGVSYFYESEVLNSSFVSHLKFSDKNPRHRKAAKRQRSVARNAGNTTFNKPKNMENEKNETITKKEGYEAMLYVLKAYWENSGSNDLTDILSGGEYWKGTDEPADSAFWEYWIESIEKVKKEGPIFKILTQK